MRRSRRCQLGVGFIEIMVVVLLLSIGFLAAAQMQVQGMRFSRSAYLESQAYFMISDIMDRMRGNVLGIQASAYNNKATSADWTDPGCDSSFCTPSQLASQDLFEWSAMLHNLRDNDNFTPLLPGTDTAPALGEIIARPSGVYRIKLSWHEVSGGSDTTQKLELDFVPWL